ncbi:hypothetical protein C8Q70DRAFT_537632 [Cubamyces menziesii]|nr:hypothetical protein C8Q70DRAFT_537632 [Cubamyces menziesii]
MASTTELPYAFTLLSAPEDATPMERVLWDIYHKGALLMPEGNRNASPLPALFTEADSLVNEVSHMHIVSDETRDDSLPSPTSPASVGSALVDPADVVVTRTAVKETENLDTNSPHSYTLPGTMQYDAESATEWDRRRLVYTFPILFTQVVPEKLQSQLFGGVKIDVYRSSPLVCVDTGTSTSWLLGYGYRIVDPNGTIRELTDEEAKTLPKKDLVLVHDYYQQDLPGSDAKWTFRAGAVKGEVQYYSGEHVDVTLMRTPLEFRLGSTHSWPHRGSEASNITMKYKFSVAYAVNLRMATVRFAGILGLSPASRQTAYPSNCNFHSFSKALLEQGVIREPETGSGIVYYFGLRPAGFSSFLGYNNWPCIGSTTRSATIEEPLWSAEIPIITGSGCFWKVRLLSIAFEKDRGGSMGWECRDGWEYSFQDDESGEEGIVVHLDTGCSLSWLPAGLTSRIRTEIFVNPNNTQLERLQGKESQFNKPNLQTYTIYVNPDVWRVKLKFRGIGDSSVVEVLAPIDPFASTMDDPNAAEGGVRMHRGMLHIAPEKHYFLGLNFFQSMFVAMHNEEPGVPERAYVRMAPQWPGERKTFQTPPVNRDFRRV